MATLEFNRNYFVPETVTAPYIESGVTTSFLRDMFFADTEKYLTDEIKTEYEIYMQNLAPFTQKGGSPIIVDPGKIGVMSFKIPEIAISRPFDINDGVEKLVGEEKYNSMMTESDRIQSKMLKINSILSDHISRTKENMCAELLMTGKITINEQVGNQIVAKRVATFSDKVRVSVEGKWSVPTTNIISQLDKYAEEMRSEFSEPQVIVLGGDAWRALKDNPTVQKDLDTRHINVAEIIPQIRVSNRGYGYSYVGKINTASLGETPIFVYNAWYDDAKTKKRVPYIDPKVAIIAPLNLGIMSYGAITVLEEGSSTHKTVVAEEYAYKKNNYETETTLLVKKSKPMPRPKQQNIWRTLEVLD